MPRYRRRYKNALDAFSQGDVEKARKILQELRFSTGDERLKIDIDLALLPCLNQADDHGLLLELTEEGISLASKYFISDVEAVFSVKRAVTLLQKQPSILHKMACIKLPNGWFNFAVERERDEHQKLGELLDKIAYDADILVERAKKIASKNPKTQFHLLFEEAHIKSQIFDARFFVYNQPNKSSMKARRWVMERRHKQELLQRLGEIQLLYLQAAKVLAQEGDETGFAYCYYQLGLQYRSAWKYYLAKRCFKKAENFAKGCNLQLILRQIEEVRKDFMQREVSGDSVDYKDFLPNT